MAFALGIDTSCYTTSIAVMSTSRELIIHERNILSVSKGHRGLRQSEAIFQHTKNLPVLVEKISEELDFSNIKMISVSSKPRPVQDSYMPVFISGVGFAKVMAKTLKVPIKYYSHQEGHIMAGAWSSNALRLFESNFLCFHISGGTTELLLVNPSRQGLHIHIIGGTKDLHAGQLIDRVGVALGLPFPCGPSLEELANHAQKQIQVPISTKGLWINFSGPETYLQRLIQNGLESPKEVALGAIYCVSESILRVLEHAMKETGINNVLMVGGVCANQIMRKRLTKYFDKKALIYFAEPEFSTDNAVGTALLGLQGLYRK